MGIDLIEQREVLQGDNKPTKVKKLPVMEIFGPTIQGEGAMCGVRTSFIRFGLCDYRCTMCDSMHAVDPVLVKQNAKWMEPKDIAEALYQQHGGMDTPNASWVTFSGGNPCIHDLTDLIYYIRGLDILGHQIKIAVETQGTKLPSWLHMCDVVTVSPKSPGMGEKFEPELFRDFMLQFKHHPGFNVKVVVFSQQDLEFAAHVNSLMVDENLGDKMYLSQGNWNPPGMDNDIDEAGIRIKLLREYRVLAEDLLMMPHMSNVKFLPQLHVLAWANKQKV